MNQDLAYTLAAIAVVVAWVVIVALIARAIGPAPRSRGADLVYGRTRERRPLPKGIKRRVNVIAPDWGVAYERDDGAPGLYAEMRGGWTADELRAIADDLDAREDAKRKEDQP